MTDFAARRPMPRQACHRDYADKVHSRRTMHRMRIRLDLVSHLADTFGSQIQLVEPIRR